MTASDALSQSHTGVIRLELSEGAAAIARSAGGFIVSFVPRDDSGLWNLAGVISIGKCSTLGEAAEAALAGRDAVQDEWEPAPENIIGQEPAVSLSPSVEGHQLRHHGRASSAPDWRLIAAGACLGIAGALTLRHLLRNRQDNLA